MMQVSAVPEVLKVGTNEMELVIFTMYNMLPDGTEESYDYGVNVAKVREIIQIATLTKVPGAPDFAECLAEVRDEVVPIVDLGKWLNINPPAHLMAKRKIIILDMMDTTVGIIVHQIQRIRRIKWDQIKPPPGFLQAKHQGRVTGVTKIGDDNAPLLLILDLENIISEIGAIIPRHEVALETVENLGGSQLKGTVLVADDSAVARKIMRDTLENAGLNVIEANDGSQALQVLGDFLERIGDQPITNFVQVVISDIEMPEMDGLTFTKNAKAHPRLRELPIIVNTSLSGDENRQKAVTVGADGYMVKFDVTTLIREITRFIARPR